MSISSIGGSHGYQPASYGGHGSNCNCPACSAARLAAVATPVPGVSTPAGTGAAPGKPLSPDQQKQVNELKARDTDVRQHEQAHIAAGGAIVSGGANYTYQEGPDGKQYAIGGDVSIRMGSGDTPQEQLDNARKVKAAALAPVDPSGQDQSVAAQADLLISQAESQVNAQQAQQLQQSQNNPVTATATAIFQAIANPSGGKTGKSVDTYA
ncbi:putative metalloprotease CJM1_0395 family protein [uncultured Aquitalea sp.]|uniref:putative metalloprotease CJM1_0395 family protein n=1 Tax=uncultured Aquitalea sp. TaxID=540272 RepID=UPI0025CF32CE|nr:putative metalloprotease CJM1_0395 family protein [uncultured Aquitalea sp.]